MLELTWYSVDGFEGSQNSDCPDGCKIDVLKVQRVFHNPEEKKTKQIYDAHDVLNNNMKYTSKGCSAGSIEIYIWLGSQIFNVVQHDVKHISIA